MQWTSQLTNLRDSLAELFPTIQVSQQVIEEAGQSISRFTFSNQAITNWHEILSEALKGDGLVDKLVTVAIKRYKENRDLAKAYETYQQVLGGHELLDDDIPKDLLWLSSQVPNIDKQWQTLHLAVCPPYRRNSSTATSVATAIHDLWRIPQQNSGAIAILQFAEGMADLAGTDPIADRIRQWAVATAQNHYKLAAYQAMQNRNPTIATQSHPVYLQLILRADNANINRSPQDYRFHLQIAWWSEELQQTLSTSEQPLKFPEIVRVVKDKFRKEIKRLWHRTSELRIECFLSMDVLCDLFEQGHSNPHLHTVDQWVLRERGSIQSKCGYDHPVMLRLLDRFEDSDATEQQLWEQRWDKFVMHTDDSCEELALWIDKEECHTSDTLYRALSANKSVAFFGTRFAPAQLQDFEDILNALLASGTPLALLPRECADTTAANNICSHVHTAHLTQLPQTVKTLRSKELDDPDHFGKQITLLWDDPTRIPKLHHFVAP